MSSYHIISDYRLVGRLALVDGGGLGSMLDHAATGQLRKTVVDWPVIEFTESPPYWCLGSPTAIDPLIAPERVAGRPSTKLISVDTADYPL